MEIDCVPFEFVDKVMATIAKTPQHVYLILTKRPQRMYRYYCEYLDGYVPLPNLFLGVSIENQQTADERIPFLLKTPAAHRFVSVEPMLGEIDMTHAMYGDSPKGMNWFGFTDGFGYEAVIDLVICGGESGPGARPMNPDWVRALRDQCVDAGVPFWFKSWGEWTAEYPQGLSLANRGMTYQNGTTFYRVGKKLAGDLLDGVEWKQRPEIDLTPASSLERKGK